MELCPGLYFRLSQKPIAATERLRVNLAPNLWCLVVLKPRHLVE